MRLLVAILLLPAVIFGATESVSVDTKTKKVQNPVVNFGTGNTLNGTGATIIGFPGSSYTFIDSLTQSAGNVSLVNDSATPGNSKYYGTNSSGTQGYFALPSGGGGTVTSIATTSPITGGTITSAGTIGINVGVDHAFTALQSITLNDASNNSIVSAFQLEHDTTGTPSVGLGASIEFRLEDNTGTGRVAADLTTAWSDVTHATRTSYLDIKLAGSGVVASTARFYGSGGLEVGSIGTDPGFGGIDSFTIRARHVAVANAGTSSSSWTPSADNFDQDSLTALAGDVTINAPSGTPSDGKKLILRIKANGSPHNITWNGAYVAMGVTLPPTISASKTIYAGCDYNSNTSKWDVLAVAVEP